MDIFLYFPYFSPINFSKTEYSGDYSDYIFIFVFLSKKIHADYFDYSEYSV